MFKKKEEILETILACLPCPQHITNLDMSKENDAIRFVWRTYNYFRVSLNGSVEEVGDGVLIRTDICILLEQLIKNQFYKSI